MRSAKETHFPYREPTVCYFEVDGDGNVSQLPHKNKSDRYGLQEAYLRACGGCSKLYAVWPGQWSSDLFEIDDLAEFAEKLLSQ